MTIIECDLLLSLFFSQHEGKRYCDVIPLTTSIDTIDKIDRLGTTTIISSRKGLFHYIILYCDTRKSIKLQSSTENEVIPLNLLDYINMEDQI